MNLQSKIKQRILSMRSVKTGKQNLWMDKRPSLIFNCGEFEMKCVYTYKYDIQGYELSNQKHATKFDEWSIYIYEAKNDSNDCILSSKEKNELYNSELGQWILEQYTKVVNNHRKIEAVKQKIANERNEELRMEKLNSL